MWLADRFSSYCGNAEHPAAAGLGVGKRASTRPENVPSRRRRAALAAWLCLTLLILVFPAWADAASDPREDGPRRLSLQQAVAIAVNRNFKITEARLEVDKKERDRRSAYSDFFPSVEVEYDATAERYQNLDNIEYLSLGHDSRWDERYINGTLVVPAQPYRIDPYKSFTLTATLTQPLFSGGKLLSRYKRAKLGVDKARIDLELEKQDLILEVHKAYYYLVLAHKLLDTANKSVQALEEHKAQSEAFYDAGLVLEVDVLSAEGQLAKAYISKRQAERSIAIQRAKLNFLLRYPQGAPVRVLIDADYKPNPYEIPDIFQIAARNRLEIPRANISVEQALAKIKSAQASLMPTASVEVSGSTLNDDWNPFDHEAYNDWSVEGIVTWSFDMFRSRETVQKRRVGHAQQFVRSQLVVEEIMEEVAEAFHRMKRAEGDIGDNRRAVRAYLANYRKNRALYTEQLATYREVLDAEREAAEAAADYYVSTMNYKIQKAVLERKMGILR